MLYAAFARITYCWSGYQYISNGDIDSGANIDICSQGIGDLFGIDSVWIVHIDDFVGIYTQVVG